MSEWTRTTWGALATLEYGKALRGYQEARGPVRVYGTNGPVGWTDRSQDAGPGVVIGRKGAYRGVHYSAGPFWVIDTAYFLRPKNPSQLHLKWAYYALLRQDINSIDSGSAIPSTSRADFYSLVVRVPSIKAQIATAEVLGALDDKIAANDSVADQCRQLGQALLDHWLVASPARSRIDDLQRQGALAYGDGYRTKRAELGRPGLGILRVADISGGTIDGSASDFIKEEYRQAIGRKVAMADDIVLTTKGSVGRVAIVPPDLPELVYSPQVCYFRVSAGSRTTPAFLWFWFQSERFRAQSAIVKGQTDMADYINLSDVGSMLVDVPSDADGPLVGKLHVLLGAIVNARGESRTLAELRDALLPKLMSGEIRVKDAEKIAEDVL